MMILGRKAHASGASITAILALAATILVGAFAPTAHAGTFVLHQCGGEKQQKGGFQAAEPHGSTYAVVDRCSDGGSAPALEVAQISDAVADKRGFWSLATQHPSLRFASVTARVKLVGGSGSRALLSATNLDQTESGNPSEWGTILASGGSTADGWETVTVGGLDHAWLKLGLQCYAARCALSESGEPTQVAKGRNFEIKIRDEGSPTVGASGPLLDDGSLIKGTQGGSVTASDPGGGVDRMETKVNGSVIHGTAGDCDVVGGVATTQTPCARTVGASLQRDVGLAPWQYGPNSVEICAYDFHTAGAANSSCTTRTVRVDNRPDGPTALGGAPAGWINDKAKLAVSVGVPSSVAPLTRMHYRLLGPAGYDRTGSKTNGFGSLAGADLPELGGPGTYALRVWFEDSLGNVSEAGTARTVEFRYDPVKPEAAVLDAHTGWVSSFDFDPVFDQTWSKPANHGSYPSGLRGYAVAISPDPDRDPCDGGPTPDCDVEEINMDPSDQSIRLAAADWPDGRYYVSAVPVTNAGNRGPRSQARLFVDRTNPLASVSGIPSGWSREPVTVTVHAEDATSGMELAPAAEMPDGPPVTALRVGSSPWAVASGGTLSQTIEEDGTYQLSYYARDLAGNRNDGSVEPSTGFRFAEPVTATARIDGTPPNGSFRRPERDDPTLQRVTVSDATSGVASVSIQLRREGTDQWSTLQTAKRESEYVTRIDEGEWERGIYEIRALATDAAGNTAGLDRFGDDSPAKLALPLREETRATIDANGTRPAKNGARWQKIGYGERPIYRGVLRDAAGRPIMEASIQIRERFDAGSVVKQRLIPTVTGRDGRFRIAGSRGPSRATRILFAGDARYQPTSSRYVRTLVRGQVKLDRYPRAVSGGSPAVFKGRIARRGVKIPDRGKIYEVQLLVPGQGWKTLDQAQKSRPDGRFRFAYRFQPVERPIRFQMRVQVKRDPEWAYTQARSRKVRVTVKP